MTGGGGAFGFDQLVKFAHGFETVLDDLRSHKLEPSADVCRILLKAGDMLVIPAGTGHLFTEVPGDHITYMMVRIDPDKVVPTKSKEQSDADLKAPPEPASPRNQLKGR